MTSIGDEQTLTSYHSGESPQSRDEKSQVVIRVNPFLGFLPRLTLEIPPHVHSSA